MAQGSPVENAVEKVGFAVLTEALDESVGSSSKKWALVLVAFVAGAAVAVWIIARRQRRSHQTVAADAEDQSASR